jgi:hypothetical protein
MRLVVFACVDGVWSHRRKEEIVSLRRWAATTAVMCAVASALCSLGSGLPELQSAAAHPQELVDRSGADALVVSVVTALAWLCWAWGAMGLLLTAASTAPGVPGRLAGLLLGGLLPAGARRAAAIALGIGLSVAAPAVLAPALAPLAVATAADLGALPPALDRSGGPTNDGTPDWPGAPAPIDRTAAPPDPDWPGPAAGEHVVLRGDCLWDIAAAWLHRQRADAPVSDGDVQRAVQGWWKANAEVIGADPDLLLPGQVLRPPS